MKFPASCVEVQVRMRPRVRAQEKLAAYVLRAATRRPHCTFRAACGKWLNGLNTTTESNIGSDENISLFKDINDIYNFSLDIFDSTYSSLIIADAFISQIFTDDYWL